MRTRSWCRALSLSLSHFSLQSTTSTTCIYIPTTNCSKLHLCVNRKREFVNQKNKPRAYILREHWRDSLQFVCMLFALSKISNKQTLSQDYDDGEHIEWQHTQCIKRLLAQYGNLVAISDRMELYVRDRVIGSVVTNTTTITRTTTTTVLHSQENNAWNRRKVDIVSVHFRAMSTTHSNSSWKVY